MTSLTPHDEHPTRADASHRGIARSAVVVFLMPISSSFEGKYTIELFLIFGRSLVFVLQLLKGGYLLQCLPPTPLLLRHLFVILFLAPFPQLGFRAQPVVDISKETT